MAKSWSMQLGSINLGTKPTGPEKPLESTPFRVLVLGDFSGRGLRASAGPQPIATKPVFVDRDNIDQVMAKMQPEVVLRLQENSPLLPLRFTELEDFHPDQLFRKLELFEGLRDLRQQLKSPKTFEAAAAKVRGWAGARPAEKKAEAPPPTAAVSGENVLEQILQQQAPAATGSVPGEGDWNQYLRKIVSPYLVEKADPKQAEFVKMVEEAIARQMRMLLHHPHFQALEAAWRGLNLLVKRLDTDHDLKLYLWDVTCHEVAADLEAEDLTKSKLYKTLVEQTVGTQGSEPWAVLVGNYTFAPSPEDALMLAKLGAVAAAARAPFLAAAESRFVGCNSFAKTPDPDDWKEPLSPEAREAWKIVRGFPQAAYLGLVLPRVLLRSPYGSKNSTTEQFPFEELGEAPNHEHFLWGNAALACGYLLASAFREDGWGFSSARYVDVPGLPTAYYRDDGETVLKPCAEALLSDRAVERIVDAGFMAMQSVARSDRVHLARWQAFSDPERGLAGRWE